MASASAPLTNVGSGYTIVTQVIPSSTAPNTAGHNSPQTLSPLQKFLKGEPKALGTVQIMNGFLTLLIGIVTIYISHASFVFYGFVFWGSLFHILSGILTVSASNKLKLCVIKGALVMNIISAISAALSIITISVDLMLTRLHYYNYGCSSCLKGVNSILLVFSLLQFVVSISISAFGCKATCSKDPALNVINVVPNPDGYVPVGSSFPAHHTQPGIRTFNAVAMNSLPDERPPAYREFKSESDN